MLKRILALALLAAPVAAENYDVYPDRLEIAGQGVPKDWRFKSSQSFSQALDLARQTPGGDTINVHGDVTANGRVTLGAYANPFGNKLGGLEGCQIVGVGEGAVIPGLTIFQTHQVSGVMFRNLEVAALTGNDCIRWGKDQKIEHSDFSFYDCYFSGYSSDVGQADWGLQFAGPGVHLYVVDSVFEDFDEHGGYLHGMAWGTFEGCKFIRCRRSGTQWMNRSWEGRASYGTNLVRNCEFTQCGEHGAASVTIGGHTGLFVIDKITIDTDHPTGGVLAYWEGPKKNTFLGDLPGSHRDENGWGITELRMVGRTSIAMRGDKTFYVTSFNDIGRLTLAPMQFGDSHKPAIWLQRPGAGRGNGEVSFGFDSGADAVWPSTEKVRKGDQTLTPAQIDSLYAPRSQPSGGLSGAQPTP